MTISNSNNINTFIKYIRKTYNLTQEELGSKLNVSRKTISAWENGRAKPDIEYLNTLSTLFNISVDQMIHNTGNNGKYFQKSNHNISLIKGLFFFQFLLFFTEILTLLNTIHILVNTFLLLACSVFIHLYTYYYYFSKSTKKDFLRKKGTIYGCFNYKCICCSVHFLTSSTKRGTKL
ncbi:helix-turn-helix transcriptional regulator [Holzapfeliella sp. JNUCC 80]